MQPVFADSDCKHRKGCLRNAVVASSEKIRDRLQWLAGEWGIPLADLPKRPDRLSDEMLTFCRKHSVNSDWMFCGDLRVLRLMLFDHNIDRAHAQAFRVEEMERKFRRLSPWRQQAVHEIVRQMLTPAGEQS